MNKPTMIPAFDQVRQRSCFILEFVKETTFNADAKSGARYGSMQAALVSTEDGLIECVDIDDLIIVWSLIPTSAETGMARPHFDSIVSNYERMEDSHGDPE